MFVQSFKSISISRMRFLCLTAHFVSVSDGDLEKNEGHIQG